MTRVKPIKFSALANRIIVADPKVEYILITLTEPKRLCAKLVSATAWSDLAEDINLPLLKKERLRVPISSESGAMEWAVRYLLEWDCSEMSERREVSAFQFDGRDSSRRARRRVTNQEEEGARLIGGRRHIGSGALSGLKSDASSAAWQLEAKQTAASSIGIKLEWLDKISREAGSQDKDPLLFVRFTSVPDEMIVEDDWVMIPAKVFRKMDGFTASS